jgi:hypothetical protein
MIPVPSGLNLEVIVFLHNVPAGVKIPQVTVAQIPADGIYPG